LEGNFDLKIKMTINQKLRISHQNIFAQLSVKGRSTTFT